MSPACETGLDQHAATPTLDASPQRVEGVRAESQPEAAEAQDNQDRSPRDGRLGPVGWFEAAPAWLASAALHLTVLILLAIFALGAADDSPLQLVAGVSEDLGDERLLDDVPLDELSEAVVDAAADTEIDLSETFSVTQPNPLVVPTPRGDGPAAVLPTTLQDALSGRTGGGKQSLLERMGGTRETEQAVLNGLRWLERQQRSDGGWSLTGPYADGVARDNRDAATAMALLAFQGAGKLPTSAADDFGPTVARGWLWLLRRQNDNGSFFNAGGGNHRFYTHAQCTIALCELLAMTGDEQYRQPARKAVEYLIATQDDLGGWKYQPASRSDLSVTGWVLMALKSARMAGIEVPSPVFVRIGEFLDSVSRADPPADAPLGSRYVYEPSDPFMREGVPTLTAVGLLCREYLGWRVDDRRIQKGIEFLLESKPVWERRRVDVYYWYYASQAILHAGGPAWPEWNGVMRRLLPETQVKRGPGEREWGSWDPDFDYWGPSGGRLYVTCLAIYTLEVYYRHLPLYQQQAVE